MFELDNIKYFKHWLAKDKATWRATDGYGINFWYLKKFLVLYKYFLVDRREVTNEMYKEIELNFQNFIDSINDEDLRSQALKYFFEREDGLVADIRHPESLLNFDDFNDVPEQDDAARKYFICYLMPIGGQSGIKAEIQNLLFQDEMSMSKIIEEVPLIISNNPPKQGRKTPKPETIIADFHAEIRNFRQLLSYMGICPEEEDGYEMNEVGNYMVQASQYLFMALYEHQKLHLRMDTPLTVNIVTKEPELKFSTKEDFADFNVNPYIAILEILEKLKNVSEDQAYIDLQEYKVIISREAPFELNSVIEKIISFRNLSTEKQTIIINAYNARPKLRNFSTGQGDNEGYKKQLQNLAYGISNFLPKYKKSEISILNFKSSKLNINNHEQFNYFLSYINYVKKYLLETNGVLYEKMSNLNAITRIENIKRHNNTQYELSDDYLENKLLKIESYFRKGVQPEERYYFDIDTLYEWKRIFSYIDPKLILFCYSNVIAFRDFDNFRNNSTSLEEINISIPKELERITGIKKENLLEIIQDIILKILNKEDFTKSTDISNFSSDLDGLKEEQIWLDQYYEKNIYSELIKNASKNFLIDSYEIVNGQRTKKRNQKIMNLEKKRRLQENYIMNEKRVNYNFDCCDICNSLFDRESGEPECHHIIPVEIYGPDSVYNYAFLCKSCHKDFTHKTRSHNTDTSINSLKLKGIIRKHHIVKMIAEDLLTHDHITYLYRSKIITTTDKLSFTRLLNEKKKDPRVEKQLKNHEKLISRLFPASERFPASMAHVYYLRRKQNLIMEEINIEFKSEGCDSCGTNLDISGVECHHIIYKNEKNLDGPETPFNYAYLCPDCHKQITFNRPSKGEVINNIKNKGVVSFSSVEKMILNEEIDNLEQIKFLHDETYLNEKEYENLIKLFEELQNFRQT